MDVRRRSQLGWAAVAASLLAVWATIRPSYFFADDYVNFSVADEMGLSWEYLNRDIFAHWLPGRRLLDWALGSFEPVPWIGVITLEVALLGVCCVLLMRLVTTLTGSRVLGLAAAAWLPLTSAMPASAQWYSGGSLPLTSLPLVLSACVLETSHATRPRALKLAAACTLVGVALLFDERSAALALAFPVLLVALGRTDWKRFLTIEGATVAVLFGWFLLQRHFTIGTVEPPPSTAVEMGGFVARGLGQSILPSLAGFHVLPTNTGSSAALWAIGALVAAALVALVVVARSRQAVLVALWTLGVFLVVLIPIAEARAHEFGTTSALEPRYAASLMPFGLLGISLLGAAASPRIGPLARRFTPTAALGGLLLVAVIPGMVHLHRNTIGAPAGDYADQLRSGQQDEPDLAFYDVLVPVEVVPAAFVPQNFLSRVLPTITSDASSIVTEPTALLVDDDGSTEPATLPDPVLLELEEASGVTAAVEAGIVCYQASEGTGVLRYRTPGGEPVERWLLQLDGRLDPQSARVRFFAGPTVAELANVTDSPGALAPPATTDTWTVAFGPRSAAYVQIELDDSGPLCLSDIFVGTP